MTNSFSLLSLSLAAVLGLSLAVLGQPSKIAHTSGRDASHDGDPHALAVAVSIVGHPYSVHRNAVELLDFMDRLPEPLSLALIGAILTFLGIILDKGHGPPRRR